MYVQYLDFQNGIEAHLQLPLGILDKSAQQRLFEQVGLERIAHHHISAEYSVQNAHRQIDIIQ